MVFGQGYKVNEWIIDIIVLKFKIKYYVNSHYRIVVISFEVF